MLFHLEKFYCGVVVVVVGGGDIEITATSFRSRSLRDLK